MGSPHHSDPAAGAAIDHSCQREFKHGETSRPSVTIPIAVIGSVVISTIISVGLQFAFLLSVDPSALNQGGWAHLDFKNMAGPFAALAAAAGAGWWAMILYVDAVISPGGAGGD